MNRYPSYKPSGVKWLGEIPSHWEVCRFKNLMSLVTTPSNDSNKIGLENIESGSGKFIQTENEFEGNGVHFQVNDVVYGKLRPYLQKVWLATFSGNAVGDFFVFRMNNKVVGKYLQYLMLSRCFTDDVNASTYGAKMPRVSSEYILTMRCAVPSKDEQIKMVSYLDTATAKIDAAIAQQQKMIDLLNERKQIIINRAVTKGLNPNAKMKDSGVEWIGEVPEHWEVRKLKHMFSRIADGTHFSPQTTDEGYPYITATDVDGKGINYQNTKKISSKDYETLVMSGCKAYKGEILLVKDGATTGRVGLKTDDVDCVTLSSVAMLRPKKDSSELFLMYLLKSFVIQEQIFEFMAGAAMPRITLVKLKNFFALLPPENEQKDIANYIEKMIFPIEEAIKITSSQISLLQERKQIIINEVVTGKVNVKCTMYNE